MQRSLLVCTLFLSICSALSVKKVLVTGGNKGIGYAVCRSLLKDFDDTFVFLGTRDACRGQLALDQLNGELGQKQHLRDRLKLITLDVCSQESVEKAASTIEHALSEGDERLYGIVNNAGIGPYNELHETMGTNYWGVRRICDAFNSLLQNPGGRIVNLSSGAAPSYVMGLAKDDENKGKLSQPWIIPGGVEELDEMAKNFLVEDEIRQPFLAYGASKALMAAYTYWLAKENPELVINCLSPGFIDTDMTRANNQGATNSPSKGAVPVLFCLMSEQVADKPQGRYYGSDCKRSPLFEYRSPGDPEYEGPDGPE